MMKKTADDLKASGKKLGATRSLGEYLSGK